MKTCVIGFVFAPVLLLVSCETNQQRALRELSAIRVKASGRSLVDAVAAKDHALASLLLEAGVFTGHRDSRGRTPLAVACDNHDYPTIWMLLAAGADVNAPLANQTSIIGVAAQHGDPLLFDTLLAAGASADGLMPDGDKILPWAIRHGHLSLVRKMLNAGADPHLTDKQGNPVLHVALESGRRDIAEWLIAHGSDPGALNAAGESTIHLAFRRDWDDMVPKLAAAGADPNARVGDGPTLLQEATQSGNHRRIDLLLRTGAIADFSPPGNSHRPSPLRAAFDSDDPAAFEVFLSARARTTDGCWQPWLGAAFHRRDFRKLRLLITHGATETRPCANGLWLLEHATLAGDRNLAKLLLDYGFHAGKSLLIASSRGDHDFASLLLAFGADPDITRFPTFDTPLSSAIRGLHDKTAAVLVRHGASTRLRSPEGQSAFHLAVTTGCHRTVNALLETGADPNEPFRSPASPEFLKLVRPGVMRWIFRNNQNPTPLMVASDSGVTATARHLLRAGAKTNVRTRSSSLWPINFASRRGDIPMMRLFLGQDPHREQRIIEVRLGEQRTRVFDSMGNELLNTKVSTGRKGFATPVGEFAITNKYRDWTSTLYHASMPYFQRFNCGDFGFHQGYVPGYPASHGCIRVPAGTAAKLFELTQTGDRVVIVP